MQHFISLIFFTAILSLFQPVIAQNSNPKHDRVKEDIIYKNIRIDTEHIFIEYEIPYGGMVEFHLYNADKTLIWKTQKINEKGFNAVRLKTPSLDDGSYEYILRYKGTDIRRGFMLSKSSIEPATE